MAMESTLQVRMDSALKAEVEALYKSLGTSFAEAVRIFAQQSIWQMYRRAECSLRISLMRR